MARAPILILFLFLANVSPCSAEVPQLFREGPFNAATLAVAVNHFVRIGEDASVKELVALSAKAEFVDPHEWRINIHERIGWVCRVLFAPKGEKPLRPPMYGALHLPDESMPLEKWPLYPVALSGTTYFVLGEGYILGGYPEQAKDYVAYCHENGIFRRTPVSVPTKVQAMKDAVALRQSEAWKAMAWKHGSPQENDFWRDRKWKFILLQAESISAKKR